VSLASGKWLAGGLRIGAQVNASCGSTGSKMRSVHMDKKKLTALFGSIIGTAAVTFAVNFAVNFNDNSTTNIHFDSGPGSVSADDEAPTTPARPAEGFGAYPTNPSFYTSPQSASSAYPNQLMSSYPYNPYYNPTNPVYPVPVNALYPTMPFADPLSYPYNPYAPDPYAALEQWYALNCGCQ